MKFKEIKQAANIAWSPSADQNIHFALGTAAQLLDATFSTESSLEIYDLKPSSSFLDLTLQGGIKSDYRFHKIVYGCMGIKKSDASNGLIVGGADGGSVLVYDPAKIIKSEENSLIHHMTKHTGPVHSLDFNKFQECLLASGASEAEIFVWDLNNPTEPIAPRFKSQPGDYVTSVAWNCQVQHILASTFSSCCVVWDLRKNEPIIKVSDSSSKFHCKMVAWHPEVATQLCLASDDDHCPVIQLWDLRFATTPVHNLEGHERGVLALSWCPHDPELLLSSGKDNRIFCWNPISPPKGDLLFSTQCTKQWSFDIAWCPRNPAIVASSSCDGSVNLFSMIGELENIGKKVTTGVSLNFENKIQSHDADPTLKEKGLQMGEMLFSLTKPPKWIKRPAGASFAFGGKLVSFSRKCDGYPAKLPICINAIAIEPKILEETAKLEYSLNSGNLGTFCQDKSESCIDMEEKFQWKFLKAVLDGSTVTKTMLLLGLDNRDSHSEVTTTIKTKSVDLKNRSDSMSNMVCPKRNRDSTEFNLRNSIDRYESEDSCDMKSDSDDIDDKLYKALLIGDIESAVELCIQARPHRWADALVLANVGGHELVQKTQKLYFDAEKSHSSKLISAVVSSDWLPFIKSCALESWKESLAAILTYSKPEEFHFLCEILGSRLEARKDFPKHHAALCYISAGNLERLAQLWATDIQIGICSLQDLIVQIVILRHAIARLSGNAPTIERGTLPILLNCFAALLASQGNLRSAAMYLSYSNEESCVLFLERIYQALGTKSANLVSEDSNMKRGINTGTFVQSKAPVCEKGMHQTIKQSIPHTHHFTPQLFQENSQQGNTGAGVHIQTAVSSSFSSNSIGFSQHQTAMNEPMKQQNDVFQYQSNLPPVVPISSVPPTSGWLPLKGQSGSSGWPHSQRYPKYASDANIYCQPSPGNQPYAYIPPYNVQQHSYTPPPPQPVNFYSTDQSGTTPFSTSSSCSPPSYNDFASGQVSQSMPSTSGSFHVPTYQVPSSYGIIETGWNDPPLLKQAAESEYSSAAYHETPAPITTPLFGPSTDSPLPTVNLYQDYTGVPPASQQQLPVVELCREHQGNTMTREENVPETEASQPKEKGPIPSEHKVMCDVFEFLQKQCQEGAKNPQIRRKLEDIPRKLENLYDLLREKSLSKSVIDGLHKIIHAVCEKDYSRALQIHGEIVSNTNFSEITGFMPSIKVLLQICYQLGVYLP